MNAKSGLALSLALLAAGALLVGAVGCDDDDFEDFFDELDDFIDDWHDNDWGYSHGRQPRGCGNCGGGWYVVDEYWDVWWW